jgi:acid phosphatase type 7
MTINSPKRLVAVMLCVISAAAGLVMLSSYRSRSTTQSVYVSLQANVSPPFRFAVYGDTRFHDPSDTKAANPTVRVALVRAIANVNPAFVCLAGDIVYKGYDLNDWKAWDSETSVFREKRIPVYPALGNHDLNGDRRTALSNYFQHFPDLKQSRYYSVRAANALILVLDSSLDEVSGAQGHWLADQLDGIPADVDFVFVMMHHPPYTSSSDAQKYGGGHSARSREQDLAKMLEDRQAPARFRILVFSGHVHNYEHHEHGGVNYFVTGGGAAHAYPIERAPEDPFQSKDINYHYLLVQVDRQRVKVTMNRLELDDGKERWTMPDNVEILPARSEVKESSTPQRSSHAASGNR